MVWVWVLIPLAGILLGGFTEWLKFKERQNKLGDSTRELGQTMSSLRSELDEAREERAALVRRVQNLETIVTSESWDATHNTARSSEQRSADLLADLEESDEKTIERMARRTRS